MFRPPCIIKLFLCYCSSLPTPGYQINIISVRCNFKCRVTCNMLQLITMNPAELDTLRCSDALPHMHVLSLRLRPYNDALLNQHACSLDVMLISTRKILTSLLGPKEHLCVVIGSPAVCKRELTFVSVGRASSGVPQPPRTVA